MPLLMLYPLLFWLSGYSIATDISGPMTVNGPERGSLMVQCVYNSGWETYLKWWCRGATRYGCKILVKTTGSEQEVKRDRVSIKDNQKNHTFTVTMEDLMQTDADTYWCGIERTGTDLGVTVQVIIDPAPVTPEETSNSPTLTDHHLDKRHNLLKLSVLLPLIFTILLLLLVAASLLAWRIMKCQQKGTAAPGGRPLLCRPDPAADQNLPTKGYHEALLLCPG
nr:CMRF35-like molecule 1 isoform X6 [Macaca fascicularis]